MCQQYVVCVRIVAKVMRDVVKIATSPSIDGNPSGAREGANNGESRRTENIWLQVEHEPSWRARYTTLAPTVKIRMHSSMEHTHTQTYTRRQSHKGTHSHTYI